MVSFRLSGGISGGEIPFNVTSVTVCKKLSDTDCVQIWKADGEQALQVIRYGAKHKGLKDTSRPERLERGRRYNVDVIAKHPSTLLFGSGHFKVDVAGARTVMSSEVETALDISVLASWVRRK